MITLIDLVSIRQESPPRPTSASNARMYWASHKGKIGGRKYHDGHYYLNCSDVWFIWLDDGYGWSHTKMNPLDAPVGVVLDMGV